MAYMTADQNLGGMFDWMGKIATPAAVALAPIPAPLKIALGVRALAQTQATSPPMNSPTDPLPAAASPLKALTPPGSSAPTVKAMAPGIADMVASALRAMGSGEKPLAPDAGSVKTVASAPAPVASQMATSPSGTPAASLPIDAETRAAVNGAAPMAVAMPALPGWVVPVAAVLGVYMLSKMVR